MNPFAFTRADSIATALSTMQRSPNARFIAGGTNILDLMKDDVERPPLLVDINALGLRTIEQRPGGIYIGALARMSDIAAHPLVRSAFPVIAVALEESASPQLRNMASIGGNVMQRTRCPYFRDTATPCNKRQPGSGCGAIAGVNRMQAVLGTSDHCIATHASDVAVAFTALDAVLHIAHPGGTREVPIGEFYSEPGRTPQIENALGRGELIVGIMVPMLNFGAQSTYLKARDRAQYEFALASAAVALDRHGGMVRGARIALGGVGTRPWRSRAAEAALVGAPATRESYQRAAEVAVRGARGYGQNDFKIPLAKRVVVRALEMVSA
ncbi:MAG TPA: xanthine dehydrogenase family protein subunit M [Candidatus Acidoferrum sp.]|nr:xanthine dehydrogenase family protein subunit M [Candidatus Acidoferrum sp.]